MCLSPAEAWGDGEDANSRLPLLGLCWCAVVLFPAPQGRLVSSRLTSRTAVPTMCVSVSVETY